jgi:CheY-like chemotaxis protein
VSVDASIRQCCNSYSERGVRVSEWARHQGIHVPRILVADDNNNIQKMVALAFEERGISVTAVGNGEAAVRRLPDLNPDLVLADVFMPVRNGYEVCEFVKKDSRFAHIPVILLVGAFDPLDEKEARRVGADGVLKKPFVPPDPLIAMVTSALEKNPKLAAELAKAKDVIVEPPKPLEPILENAVKREPAPLPSFPEPTPEEAAAIYGFGKGIRALGDEPEVKEAKPPVLETKEEKDDEEFDGAATTRDWRRTAGLDLEIPEGTTTDTPSYSFGGDSSSITFPSERDVPPRRISEREIASREAAPENAATVNAPATIEPAVEAPSAASAAEQKTMPAGGFFRRAELQPVIAFVASEQVSEPAFAKPDEKIEKAPAANPEAPSEIRSDVRSEAVPASRATEWMEMMSPAPAENRTGGWWTDAIASDAPAYDWRNQTASISEASPAATTVSEPVTETRHESAEASPNHDGANHDDDSFFADAPAPNESRSELPPPVADEIQTTVRQAVYEVSQKSESSSESSSASRPAPDFGHEILVAPADAELSHAEPQDQAAPLAFERLFAESQPSAVAEQSLQQQEAPEPPQRFLPPAAEQFSDSAAEEAITRAEISSFESESASTVFSERIPTAPPPNREALAHIPFLIPPAPPVIDSSTVDAVAQRVLERLDPQLRNLLSKDGLKSLVENMLQQEIEKKTK